MIKRTQQYLIILFTLFISTTAFGQSEFRNITSARFNYFSDTRLGLNWEEVFIAPLPEDLYLVTAVTGLNSSYQDVTGGRLGLAFNLPGSFYGEGSYALEYDWLSQYFIHTAVLSATYESGPAMATLNLKGEFSPGSIGGIVSPGVKYFIQPKIALSGTMYIALTSYTGSSNFFNFAFLGLGEFGLSPEIWLNLGGTFGTVYEPENKYEKWSLIGGIKVLPSARVAVSTQFEYTNSMLHPTNPHEIFTIGLLLDFKFPRKK